ncbi:MAG: hypothetical protein CMJ89_04810 [Planctomycetes bacterium]|jgi:uncharacterized protein (DUF1501 family)|nr:hypothetical protein [Planctomycetota bacterium]
MNARNGFSRRQVLAVSSAAAASTLFTTRASASPRAFLGNAGGNDVFVQIFLRGGMDGLTTVVPYGEVDLYNARPTLAVPPPGQTNAAVDLDGFFGLAPSAAPLMTPYQNGHLAFVHAAGSPDPTRSHFDAFAHMEFGGPNLPPGTVQDGWLSRYLDQVAGPDTGVLRGIGAGDLLPLTLAGAPKTLPIADFANFAFPGNPATVVARVQKLTSMYAATPAPVGPAALNTFDAIDLMATIDFAGYAPSNGAQYPNTQLGSRLREIAALIKADIGVETINVDFHSWDLHAQLGPLDGNMAIMLDELSRSLEAFYLDMGSGIDGVSLVCLSEFGRRVEENSSLGLDHGHGAVMILMGGHIQGGQVFADWPGLAPAQLDQGDLAVTIDYRDILGEILTRRLGATDLTTIFPQHSFTTYGVTV